MTFPSGNGRSYPIFRRKVPFHLQLEALEISPISHNSKNNPSHSKITKSHPLPPQPEPMSQLPLAENVSQSAKNEESEWKGRQRLQSPVEDEPQISPTVKQRQIFRKSQEANSPFEQRGMMWDSSEKGSCAKECKEQETSQGSSFLCNDRAERDIPPRPPQPYHPKCPFYVRTTPYLYMEEEDMQKKFQDLERMFNTSIMDIDLVVFDWESLQEWNGRPVRLKQDLMLHTNTRFVKGKRTIPSQFTEWFFKEHGKRHAGHRKPDQKISQSYSEADFQEARDAEATEEEEEAREEKSEAELTTQSQSISEH